MWLQHSGFRQECEQWWRGIEVEGWESYRIMEKLRVLKDKLQVWNKEVFGDTRIIKKEVVEKIAGLDKKEEMTQLDVGERELRLSLKNQLEELVFKEAVAWRQKMKFRWIKEWDYNSAMFHRMVSFWKSKNIINRIVKEDETVLTDQREIEEIKKAVFEIDREKSPGPDGYTGAFFQNCWGILKNDMVKIFEEFYRNGKVCGNMNHTFLCLIPKKLDVQQVKDFRPISLVSGETISMTQGAFVHNRQILDVVLVATEAVEDYRKRKKRGVIFKVDFEKAYDHVNWDFLDLVLEKKGFGVRWRTWMRGCISSANFSIMINGKPRGRFGASRGLRQGDPLSPFLFILVADILGRMMDKAVSIGEVKGFKKMMRQFLWDKEVGGKGKSLVDWKLVCTPKENKALLGKWLWRFPLEQHTLWAAVIRSKYGLNREGWDSNLVTKEPTDVSISKQVCDVQKGS
ncbi:hypothetical protein UlMin_033508 [Ulmus minor]